MNDTTISKATRLLLQRELIALSQDAAVDLWDRGITVPDLSTEEELAAIASEATRGVRARPHYPRVRIF
jgi:hypothetical protein